MFKGKKKAIFVHGCFWHRHPSCASARIPKSNEDFWLKKLENNVERDKLAIQSLEDNGWSTYVVWECEIKDVDTLRSRLLKFLER